MSNKNYAPCIFVKFQPLGYEHCRGVVDGWQKDRKMHHLLNEDCKRQHTLDKLTKQNSNSVRDLVALAAQIFRPPPESEDPGIQGYWSNPEDQVMYFPPMIFNCNPLLFRYMPTRVILTKESLQKQWLCLLFLILN